MLAYIKGTLEMKMTDYVVIDVGGLGYKVYNYKRESYRAIEFGPFWSKDRSNQ